MTFTLVYLRIRATIIGSVVGLTCGELLFFAIARGGQSSESTAFHGLVLASFVAFIVGFVVTRRTLRRSVWRAARRAMEQEMESWEHER